MFSVQVLQSIGIEQEFTLMIVAHILIPINEQFYYI